MVQNIKNKRGSEWRKWDLHIHTPLSTYQNYGGNTEKSWEKFISDLEALPEEFKVIGINDYLFLDGYEKVLSYKTSGRLKNIDLILPVLEFRLSEFAGVDFGEYKRPNIHVIFADESILNPDLIKSQFLATLDAKYKLEKDGKNFQRTLTKDSLIELGKQIIDSVPTGEKSKYGVPEIEGFNNLNLNLEQIKKSLENDCFGGKYFLAIGKTEWNEIKWSDSSIGSKKTLINSCRIIFTSSESVENFKKAKNKLKEQKVNDLLLDCSDAHNFSDSKDSNGDLVKDRVGKCFTWIKAEPTFEGLRQIVYEPETRISIGDEKPKKPINTINSITLQVPDNAKVSEDKFCFAGNKNTYDLSPYFNCFIGGRGSGKSTILNFLGLYSNNPAEPKQFWDKLNPSFNPNKENVFSFEGTEIFEFLAQSEIETFARDKTKFTQAIYGRANKKNILGSYEDDIENLQYRLDQIIQAAFDITDLEIQKKEKEKEKRTLEKSIKVLSSGDYQTSIKNISTKSKKLQELESWKQIVSKLRKELENLLSENEEGIDVKEGMETQKTGYEDAYNLAIQKIGKVVDVLKKKIFTKDAENEVKIKKELKKLEDIAKGLLEKAGLSTENVEQIKSAPQKITILEAEIKSISTQIDSKNKIVDTLNKIIEKLKADKQSYEDAIIKILNPLQDRLKKQSDENKEENIKQISLTYSFDKQKSWSELSNEFYNVFRDNHHDTEKGADVCDFLVQNKKQFAKDDLEILRNFISQNDGEQKYIKFLNEVFKNPLNFQIFQAIRGKHLYDVKSNKIVQVEYDGKSVDQASFGQRCTAVVVILILFGNYPLIIDEPEAHLDSSLIANYLVPLLKKKKSDRQIIFASHNANFVINGDAEKIFILKNDTGITKIIETTIEDVKNRDELLKLEGGKEAFEKRGEKLNIK